MWRNCCCLQQGHRLQTQLRNVLPPKVDVYAAVLREEPTSERCSAMSNRGHRPEQIMWTHRHLHVIGMAVHCQHYKWTVTIDYERL